MKKMEAKFDQEDMFIEAEKEKEENRDTIDSSDSEGSDYFEICKEEPNEIHNEGDEEKQPEDENQDEIWRNYVALEVEDVLGKEFQCFEDAYKFYSDYALCCGFVVRKDDVGKNKDGEIRWRQYVCNREGERNKKHLMRSDRKREHRPLTRTKCTAKMRVNLDDDNGKWIVSQFNPIHNHNLTRPDLVHLMTGYRKMKGPDKAQVDVMHAAGVRTGHIFGFLVGQAGGYAGLGFCKKDLYNHIHKRRREMVVNGDACAALSYLQAKADNDPAMYGIYTTDADTGKLQNLFWADGTSRADYELFNDVLAFDTTYKINKYEIPLIIFSGLNHHGGTTVFGCGLLLNESFETYMWVLTSFLEAMGGKHPGVVVTDGDKSMRKAIKAVLPTSTHRLCAWHMNKNATKNVPNKGFLKKFKTCVYANFDIDEFEKYWKNMVEEYGLSKNKWVKKAFKRREMWATAYHRQNFYAGLRTTSRCEGINAFIKRYVKHRCNLFEFVHNFERAIRDYRNNELVEDFKTMYGQPVITSPLGSLQQSAASLYTRRMYNEFKIQLDEAAALFVVHRDEVGDLIEYKLHKYCHPNYEYKLVYDRKDDRYKCYCKSYETRGIPCCHILCVLKHEHVAVLPSSLICRRWTKDAKAISGIQNDAEENSKRVFMLRYGSLGSSSNWLSYLAAHNQEDYKEIRNEYRRLTMRLEKRRGYKGNENGEKKERVNDPEVVKTKGAPQKRKRATRKVQECSHCHIKGHNRSSCPLNAKNKRKKTVNASNSSSDSDDIDTNERLEMRETEPHDHGITATSRDDGYKNCEPPSNSTPREPSIMHRQHRPIFNWDTSSQSTPSQPNYASSHSTRRTMYGPYGSTPSFPTSSIFAMYQPVPEPPIVPSSQVFQFFPPYSGGLPPLQQPSFSRQ